MSLTDLYNEVFEEEVMEKQAEAELEEEAEMMTKIAEDYVTAGRLMARGYADEMEKLAAEGGAEAGAAAGEGAKKGKGMLRRAAEKTWEVGSAPFRKGYYTKAHEHFAKAWHGSKAGTALGKDIPKELGKLERLGLLGKGVARYGTLPAIAGAGYGLYKLLKKKSAKKN